MLMRDDRRKVEQVECSTIVPNSPRVEILQPVILRRIEMRVLSSLPRAASTFRIRSL